MIANASSEIIVRGSLTTGATFSACGQYRYLLWRYWKIDGECNPILMVGLNPSKADETHNDPTIRRCIQFAKDWGFDGLLMANVFAYMATQPKQLFKVPDPIGSDNDRILTQSVKQAKKVVVAWGNHCPRDRQDAIAKLIDKPLYCLGLNKNGSPKHPLYLAKTTQLRRYSPLVLSGIIEI